ncbi:hypothetical protein QCA50_006982 [Cerrena zonata]|uniref:Uncharacterized protein n=1 Tax=Cerrena zonata TaxID=2478898 RepID=A0AAW0GMH1_9APHY
MLCEHAIDPETHMNSSRKAAGYVYYPKTIIGDVVQLSLSTFAPLVKTVDSRSHLGTSTEICLDCPGTFIYRTGHGDIHFIPPYGVGDQRDGTKNMKNTG